MGWVGGWVPYFPRLCSLIGDLSPSPCSHVVSSEFEAFLTKNGIKHLTTAPYHPAFNVLAERSVQIVKTGLKRNCNVTFFTRLRQTLATHRLTPQCELMKHVRKTAELALEWSLSYRLLYIDFEHEHSNGKNYIFRNFYLIFALMLLHIIVV